MTSVGLTRSDLGPALLAASWLFLVLTANALLRPLREAIGIDDGVDIVRWLFIATMACTLIANGGLGLLVSMARSRSVIVVTYLLIALMAVAFYVLIITGPDSVSVVLGRVFYVWLSVVNMFAVALFWAFVVDRLGAMQVRRAAGIITVGGTLGTIVGAAGAGQIAAYATQDASALESVGGVYVLMPLAAVVLLMAVGVAWLLDRDDANDEERAAPVQGSWTDAVTDLVRSKYLFGIAVYVGIAAIVATLLYFTKLRIVEAAVPDRDERTGLFAMIDLWANIAVLATQLLLTSRVLTRVGPAPALAAVPLVSVFGLALLAVTPLAYVLPIFIAVEMAMKAGRYGFMRPGREVLFTVVARPVKFRAKPMIDTFVYRFADVLGAATDRGIAALAGASGLALSVGLTAAVGIPIATGWMLLGIVLGRSAQRQAASLPQEGTPE